MKKLTLILTLIIGFSIISCSSDDDNGNQASEFQGSWNGTYSGDQDNETWIMTVDENGTITGTSISNVFNETFDVNGNVQGSGNLNATVGTATSGATFVGTFNATTASGTWNNTSASMNGTWSGNKQ